MMKMTTKSQDLIQNRRDIMEIIILAILLIIAVLQLIGRPFKIEITHRNKVEGETMLSSEEPTKEEDNKEKEITQVLQEMMGVMNNE